jgi:biopolymer transport protein ExbD
VQHEVLGEKTMNPLRRWLTFASLSFALGACAGGEPPPPNSGPIIVTGSSRDKRMIVITITKEGKCLYEGSPLSSCDDVFEAAEERLKFAPQTEVVVIYDRTVQQTAVVGVIEQLKRAGIQRVSLSEGEGG